MLHMYDCFHVTCMCSCFMHVLVFMLRVCACVHLHTCACIHVACVFLCACVHVAYV